MENPTYGFQQYFEWTRKLYIAIMVIFPGFYYKLKLRDQPMSTAPA